MNGKVIVDGLALQVAHDVMGYLQTLREAGCASPYRLD